MECKAHGEAKYRSNLRVVRILARRVTQQSAHLFNFYFLVLVKKANPLAHNPVSLGKA